MQKLRRGCFCNNCHSRADVQKATLAHGGGEGGGVDPAIGGGGSGRPPKGFKGKRGAVLESDPVQKQPGSHARRLCVQAQSASPPRYALLKRETSEDPDGWQAGFVHCVGGGGEGEVFPSLPSMELVVAPDL